MLIKSLIDTKVEEVLEWGAIKVTKGIGLNQACQTQTTLRAAKATKIAEGAV